MELRVGAPCVPEGGPLYHGEAGERTARDESLETAARIVRPHPGRANTTTKYPP